MRAAAEVPLPPDLLSFEQALDAVLSAIPGPLGSEDVAVGALHRALGRALAADIVAATDLPPWDNSAMDGYAIRAADVADATEDHPARLIVVGEVAAGGDPPALTDGATCIRIATGAPLPRGADAVVPVEFTTPLGADGDAVGRPGDQAAGGVPAACLVHQPVAAGASIRRRGEDVRAGDVVASAGTPLTPALVALAAGIGVGTVRVHARPFVGVLATGDEVRPAGSDLGPSGIPDANGPALRALVASVGGEPVDLGVAPDDLDSVVARLESVLGRDDADGGREVDAVVVSGGVSVGPYDVVRAAFGAVGEVDLWRVAIQPGKPFAFGRTTTGAVLFGLPGNPVSTFVTFELFVRPALRRLAGLDPVARSADRCVLADAASSSVGRRTFVRVVADRAADGTVQRDDAGRAVVRLAGGQGSHVLSSLAAADGLAIVPEAMAAVPAGTELDLWWLAS